MHTGHLLLLGSLCIPTLLDAQFLEWGTEMDASPTGVGYYRPRIALNADLDPIVIWGDAPNGTAHATVWNGTSFNVPQLLHPAGVQVAAADWQGPELDALGNEAWVVFKALPEMDMPMYAVRSLDGGTTWSDTLRIGAATGPFDRFPTVALGPSAGAVVEYMAFDSGFTDPRHVTTRWVGGAWEPPVPVSAPFAPGEVCDCCPGRALAQGDTVVVVYRNNDANLRTIWAGMSGDGGATCTSGADIDPTGWTFNTCPSSSADGAIAGDSLRYVLMSGASQGLKVYAGSTHLPDLTVGPFFRIDPSAGSSTLQQFPRMAGSGDTLGIVWQRTMSGNKDVLFSWSVTGWAGLSAPQAVTVNSAGPQMTPDIAFANGIFRIVWSDQSADVVRYRSATIMGLVGISGPSAGADVHFRQDPANGALWLDLSGTRGTMYRIHDMAGAVVARGTWRQGASIPINGLPTGSYVLTLPDVGFHGHFVRTYP
ncbi:MAG: hypothetical protein KDB97_05595 [Flavobacteriales bacterium]|nr:hypothetical protein [Flavobacteriales bacterium]